MTNDDYTEAWEKLLHKRMALLNQRTELETQLSDLNVEIAHLEEVNKHLAPLAGITLDETSIIGLGITDAIRTVLRNSQTQMAPADVRRELGEKGFDFSGQSHPMASIYKILQRLTTADEIEKVADQETSRVYYAWKRPSVNDEDIPF